VSAAGQRAGRGGQFSAAGVPTMLVERYGCLGGNLTHVGSRASLVPAEKTVDSRESVLNSRRGPKIRRRRAGAAIAEPCHQCGDVQDRGDNWVQEAGSKRSFTRLPLASFVTAMV